MAPVVLRGLDAAVADLLSHLYVLIPVLDDAKHYWVGKDEVEKLLARGEGWLRVILVQGETKITRTIEAEVADRVELDLR